MTQVLTVVLWASLAAGAFVIVAFLLRRPD
jgi:Flp pilus assembly protein protease CpaA